MKALEILNKELVGSYFNSFQVGDWWVLTVDGYYLSFLNVISKDEGMLNEWLNANYAPFRSTVDKEYVSKCIVLSSHMRREITKVELGDDYSLTICFENNSELFIPVDVDVVDWQWCLNKSGKIPYNDYIIACFWKGEIAINEQADTT